MSHDLTDRRGAVYLTDWNAHQFWANYGDERVDRHVMLASALGLNTLRVWASYEYWRDDGPDFFANVEHLLTACHDHGIAPVVVLFEAPPKNPPTPNNCEATGPGEAFGVHSPSRAEVLQADRGWQGWARSPLHFARRWAQKFGDDPRLLATEIMNEPGDVRPRRQFVSDMLQEVADHTSEGAITMGCKDIRFNAVYDGGDLLDAYQYHMNLPADGRSARDYMEAQHDYQQGNDDLRDDVPLWCTEWQRTMEQPPVHTLPNYQSLAPIIRRGHSDGLLDGDFFWGLMLQPAYLKTPRRNGRINGLFHDDGTPFDPADYAAIQGAERSLPEEWADHPFPYPDPGWW